MAFDLEQFDREVIRRMGQLTADDLREKLAAGTLKPEELTPRQRELLKMYPPEEQQSPK